MEQREIGIVLLQEAWVQMDVSRGLSADEVVERVRPLVGVAILAFGAGYVSVADLEALTLADTTRATLGLL